MIRISDISMPLHYTDEALRRAAAKKLRTDVQTLKKLALKPRMEHLFLGSYFL